MTRDLRRRSGAVGQGGLRGPRWGHGGFYPGYRTVMAYFPRQRVAVVVQTNTTAEGANSFSEQFVAEALRLVVDAVPR